MVTQLTEQEEVQTWSKFSPLVARWYGWCTTEQCLRECSSDLGNRCRSIVVVATRRRRTVVGEGAPPTTIEHGSQVVQCNCIAPVAKHIAATAPTAAVTAPRETTTSAIVVHHKLLVVCPGKEAATRLWSTHKQHGKDQVKGAHASIPHMLTNRRHIQTQNEGCGRDAVNQRRMTQLR